MDWKFFMLFVMAMPTLMLAFFLLALSLPQLGLLNGTALLWGAVGSLIIAFPAAWFIAKKIF